ncbi:hypothetical protein ACEN19_03725 [Corynebacterium auriscanis]|uniref:hypothetical protein n=1 Tax=Corynebacterium auriscanis TaxID=99807 RepID=UPI003CEC87E1
MTLQDVDTEYVAEALRREGEGVFYYRRPGEPQLFLTRESAILGIRQFIIAFGPDDVVSEGYDIGAIFNELVHLVSKPPFYEGYSRWIYAIVADQQTIEEVIVKHELSREQLLDQISERVGDVRHAVGASDETLARRSQWIDGELNKIINLTIQVRRRPDSPPRG